MLNSLKSSKAFNKFRDGCFWPCAFSNWWFGWMLHRKCYIQRVSPQYGLTYVGLNWRSGWSFCCKCDRWCFGQVGWCAAETIQWHQCQDDFCRFFSCQIKSAALLGKKFGGDEDYWSLFLSTWCIKHLILLIVFIDL